MLCFNGVYGILNRDCNDIYLFILDDSYNMNNIYYLFFMIKININ